MSPSMPSVMVGKRVWPGWQRPFRKVDTHHRIRPGRGRVVAFDLDRERAEPPSALVGDGGRADTAGAAFEMPGELAGGLVGADQADAGQLHMPAVGVGQAERAGGEPARHRPAFALEAGNRTVGPRRFPVFEACQLPSAVARFARPEEYASL